MAERPVLHGYWRSTAAYRVRMALNLKGIDWENRPVDLVAGGGQQHSAAYRGLNPTRLVPTLEIDGLALGQSLAICEYLDETRPGPSLLPDLAADRAWVRALAQDVACDIHPINNLRVQQYLKGPLGQDDEAAQAWMDHWMRAGFDGIEIKLSQRERPGPFCLGNVPGLADICLVGQVYNARRFGTDLGPYPLIREIDAACRALPAIADAAPERQPDAPAS